MLDYGITCFLTTPARDQPPDRGFPCLVQAFEAHPDTGMMVEYPHLPNGILDTVLPQHFNVDVSIEDYENMMETSQKYSKVCTY